MDRKRSPFYVFLILMLGLLIQAPAFQASAQDGVSTPVPVPHLYTSPYQYQLKPWSDTEAQQAIESLEAVENNLNSAVGTVNWIRLSGSTTSCGANFPITLMQPLPA
jgi:hypothetical protein